jgi:hypothetical protein
MAQRIRLQIPVLQQDGSYPRVIASILPRSDPRRTSSLELGLYPGMLRPVPVGAYFVDP